MLTEATDSQIERLPEEFQSVSRGLASLFGEALLVDDDEPGWLMVKVRGMTDQCVFMTLDRERYRVFGDDFYDFQILCPSDPSRRPGVWLHDLSDDEVRAEYLQGFWYY